jgi:glycosyltransferase involved in cell wall biosynthesis
MKIALVEWEISKTGGITTVRRELKDGLIKLGHIADDYYIPDTQTTELKRKDGYFKDFTKVLNYKTPEQIAEYKNIMTNYDTVIFVVPCPTQNRKEVKAMDPTEARKWQECYNISARIISIFHDPSWRRGYSWIEEMFPKIDKIVCIQEKAYYSLVPPVKPVVSKKRSLFDDDDDVPVVEKPIHPNIIICNHPLSLDDMGTYKELKEDLVISPHQFKPWKHIEEFIKSVPIITQSIKKEVFNTGQEYNDMNPVDKTNPKSIETGKKKGYLKSDGTWIWQNALSVGMNYRAFVSKEELNLAFKRSKCMVDLSVGESGTKTGYPSVNYSVLEAIKYGSVPVVRMQSVLPRIWSPLDFYVVEEPNLVEATARAVNDICKNYGNYEQMIKGAQEKLKIHYDNKVVAKKILE